MLCEGILEKIAREEGLTVLGWRDTPINGNTIGRLARSTQPYIEQIFIRRAPGMDQDALERKLYVVRKRAETAVAESDFKEKDFFYIPSLSSRTIVYKGLLLAPQITDFYKELLDAEVTSALCLVHQRFSTNTFPSWQAGASLPLHLPQRRNQHAARQCELDVCAAVRAGFAAVRRRHQKAAAHHHCRAAAIRPCSTTPWNC